MEAAECAAEMVILSSEVFQGQNLRPILEYFPKASVEVVLFVRRYDRFFESLVAQDAKVGVLIDIPSFTGGHYKTMMGHFSEAENFSRVVGDDRVKVIHYREGVDARQTFLSQLGLPVAGLESSVVNTGLTTIDIWGALLLNKLYRCNDGEIALSELMSATPAQKQEELSNRWRLGFFLNIRKREELLAQMEFDNQMLHRRFGFTENICKLEDAERASLIDVDVPPMDLVFERVAELIKAHKSLQDLIRNQSVDLRSEISFDEYYARVKAIA